jgi:hypothetical protein
MITLIQRQSLPFAFVYGTPQPGLTGTGSISVQGAIGVDVQLTTIPGAWGYTSETPRRLIPSAGSIQASDGVTYTDNYQLHYQHQVIEFDAPWATTVRYNIRSGFVATLTPVLREP